MQIEEDLVTVSEMAVRGCTYNEIMAKVSISRTQLKRDLNKIRERWRERQTDNMDVVVGRELEKLDLIERKAFEAYEKSESSSSPGDPQYLMLVLKCMERRARLLGIERPIEQHNHLFVESENIALSVVNNPTLREHEKQFWLNASAAHGESRVSGDSADGTE